MLELTDYIQIFALKTKKKIAEQVLVNIPNEQKKANLDVYITNWVNDCMDGFGLNPIVKWIVKKFIIANLPTITQLIFDMLKTKIQGLTE